MPSTKLKLNMTSTSYLDSRTRRCRRKDGVFTSTASSTGPTGKETAHQSLVAYSGKHLAAGRVAEMERPCQPISWGAEGETRSIEGYPAYWAGNRWEVKTATYTIEIKPETDLEDLKAWLIAFNPIQDKIIGRGLGTRPIILTVGEHPWENDEGTIARATNRNKTGNPDEIWFFTSGNSSRLLGATIEAGTKGKEWAVSLKGMILHEIGHTIENLLVAARAEIEAGILDNMERAGVVANAASPHYLGEDWGTAIEDTLVLEKAKRANQNVIFVQAGTERTISPEQYERWKKQQWTSEIFAEVIREYYLEPTLEGKPKHAPQTGWDKLDELTEFLRKEVEESLRAERTKRAPMGVTPPALSKNSPKETLADGVSFA